MRANLEAGRVLLLFVADRIPAELRRVVEFLNRQMRPAEVLAVELRQYAGEGLKTLVPTVLGQSEEAARRKAGPTAPKLVRRWDEAGIVDAIAERYGANTAARARRVVDWIGRADKTEFTTNSQWGWIGAATRIGGVDVPTLRLHTDGTMAVYFEYMLRKPVAGDLAVRQDLLDRLNAVPGVRLPPDAVSKRKGIALSSLSDPAIDTFLAVMDDFTERLRAGERQLGHPHGTSNASNGAIATTIEQSPGAGSG